jgi:hypothetical protein
MKDFRGVLQDLLAQERLRQFAGIQGASLKIVLPLREDFVNTAIAAGIANGDAPVKEARIQFHGGGRISVEINPKLFLVPNIRLELRAPEITDLQQDGTVRIQILPESGAIGLLLQTLNFLKRPPEGITITATLISLHLPTLLERQNRGDLVPYLKQLMVTGQPGTLFLHLQCEVP